MLLNDRRRRNSFGYKQIRNVLLAAENLQYIRQIPDTIDLDSRQFCSLGRRLLRQDAPIHAGRKRVLRNRQRPRNRPH